MKHNPDDVVKHVPSVAVVGPAPPLQVYTGAAAVTIKKAPELSAALQAGTGVGAGLGGNVPPGLIEIVSMDMSPVNEVVLFATNCTEVVPAGRDTPAKAQAEVRAVCCWPDWDHRVVHTVPTHVFTKSVPMLAPYM